MVYSMARNSVPMREELVTVCVGMRGEAWRCVAMRARWSSACRIVAKILKCSKIYFQRVTTCHDEIVTCTRAWHWLSRTSWTVRNLCVTDGTTWRGIAQTMRHLAVLTDIVPPKWHDLVRHRGGALWEQNLISCQCEACSWIISSKNILGDKLKAG